MSHKSVRGPSTRKSKTLKHLKSREANSDRRKTEIPKRISQQLLGLESKESHAGNVYFPISDRDGEIDEDFILSQGSDFDENAIDGEEVFYRRNEETGEDDSGSFSTPDRWPLAIDEREE